MAVFEGRRRIFPVKSTRSLDLRVSRDSDQTAKKVGPFPLPLLIFLVRCLTSFHTRSTRTDATTTHRRPLPPRAPTLPARLERSAGKGRSHAPPSSRPMSSESRQMVSSSAIAAQSLLLLPLLLFLPLLFLCSPVSAQVSPGSTLYASGNRSWPSPSQAFSLGFVPAAADPSSFLAAITYAGGPAVVVWSAGGSAVDSSGFLQFLSTGNLRLVNGSGATVWESNTTGRGVTSANLDDTGNLVLRNGTSSVWSSFDHPTDTIVPSQNFTVGQTLRSGPYSFNLSSSGNLTLWWNTSIEYWNQGLNSSIQGNLTAPTLGLQTTGILYISDPSLSSYAIIAYSSDYAEGSDILRFLRLDSDGNLKIFSSARNSGTKTVRWAAVDQCEVFGFCGNLGICSYNDSAPMCRCPSQNFEPIDPNDSRKGCKRKVNIEDCPGSATMLELGHASFLTYPPELSSQVFFVGISACRLNCLVSGSCMASTSLSDGTGLCYLKSVNFVSGYENPALPSTSYVKVCGPVVPNPSSLEGTGKNKGWRLHAWVVVVVVLATVLGLILLEGGLWWSCFRNSTKFGALSSHYTLLEYASGAPVQFTYKELQRATKGFKEKLGAGGFGAVYRGILTNRTVVAVKQLEGIEQGEKQFRMEVATIMSGRRNFDVSVETNNKKFSMWAYEEFEKSNAENIIDKRLFGADQDLNMEQVMRAIQICFWCIQEQPSHRPTMGKILQMLDGITEIERPPPPKAAVDGSHSGSSINVSSNISALSTFAASAPPPSSSSRQTSGVSPVTSGRNIEKASSSHLNSDSK
ncbi:hypothetical protein NL676_026458 [Syzygium grande]|nr:hypothetical protein NL676_026458 [Syzygium grande]